MERENIDIKQKKRYIYIIKRRGERKRVRSEERASRARRERGESVTQRKEGGGESE